MADIPAFDGLRWGRVAIVLKFADCRDSRRNRRMGTPGAIDKMGTIRSVVLEMLTRHFDTTDLTRAGRSKFICPLQIAEIPK